MKADLDTAWFAYRQIRAEAHRLHTVGINMHVESGRLWGVASKARTLWIEDRLKTEASTLKTEADKLYAESSRLYTAASVGFELAVYRTCGQDVGIEWTETGCIVAGVMEFLYEG